MRSPEPRLAERQPAPDLPGAAGLRLVYASWYGDLGGGELRMLDHLRHTAFPRDRTIALLNQRGGLEKALQREGIATRLFPWKTAGGYARRQWQWYRTRWALAQFLRAQRPSLVVCNTYPDLETTGRVAAQLGLPLIWRARADTFTATSNLTHVQVRELVEFLNGPVSRIVATTRYEPARMLEAGVDPRKVHVVHNGVDLWRYENEASGQRLRADLGFTADDFVIACVARMVPQKGYEVLFRALAALRARGRPVKAIVAGDTTLLEEQPEEYRRSLSRLVSELALVNDLRFLGFREDVWAVMNAADAFVLSSLKEPFGTTVVEAMAASRAVIASDLPGPRESVVEGVTGMFFPAGDSEALAHRIAMLADRPDLRASMAAAGRARAAEMFDLRRNIALLDRHCLEVAQGVGGSALVSSSAAVPS